MRKIPIYNKSECTACILRMWNELALVAKHLPDKLPTAVQAQHASRSDCPRGPCYDEKVFHHKISAAPGEAFDLTVNGAKIHDSTVHRIQWKRIQFREVEIVYEYRHERNDDGQA